MKKNFRFLLVGICFGIVLTKSEALSWFRIQEMFRFESFHMYGILGSAIITAIAGLWLIKKFKSRTINGEAILIPKQKPYTYKYLLGGICFGLGWALTGACPGPIYALIGNGYLVYIVVLVSALAGVLFYHFIKEKIPH